MWLISRFLRLLYRVILNVADADTPHGLSPRRASLYQRGYGYRRLKLCKSSSGVAITIGVS